MFDDGVALEAFTERVVVGDDSVPEHRRGHALEVAHLGRRPAIQERAGFGGGDEMLRGSRACAPGDVAAHIIVRA